MTEAASRRAAGFAQILVLVSLTGIGGLVTASLIESMTASQAAAALQWTIESEALAASAFTRISDAVADPSDKLELSLLEGKQTLDLGIGTLSAAIESENSKLNLMLADLALLQRYAINAGLSATEANAFVADIVEARKGDHAAETFDRMLRYLAGERPYSELAADFTVVGMVAGIAPAFANARVLSAIPDLSPAQVQLIASTPASARVGVASSKYYAQSGSRYSLIATIRKGTHQSQRRLIVEITASGRLVAVRLP